jgi:hypothetical protein
MTTLEDWMKDQLKPLSMFEIAKWWADGIKMTGAGNGAGFLTAGAALTIFRDHHRAFLEVKLAGFVFFVGIIAFAIAFLQLYIAMHAQDEVAQATLHKDAQAVHRNSAISGGSMMLANKCAIASTAAFFIGCVIGLIAFLSF